MDGIGASHRDHKGRERDAQRGDGKAQVPHGAHDPHRGGEKGDEGQKKALGGAKVQEKGDGHHQNHQGEKPLHVPLHVVIKADIHHRRALGNHRKFWMVVADLQNLPTDEIYPAAPGKGDNHPEVGEASRGVGGKNSALKRGVGSKPFKKEGPLALTSGQDAPAVVVFFQDGAGEDLVLFGANIRDGKGGDHPSNGLGGHKI